MKTVELKIENMANALEALNESLQLAARLIHEKNASEAAVTISIHMEMRPDGFASWIPTIKYKTSVKVPVEIRNVGQATNAAQVYWDQEAMSFMMAIDGEQVLIE